MVMQESVLTLSAGSRGRQQPVCMLGECRSVDRTTHVDSLSCAADSKQFCETGRDYDLVSTVGSQSLPRVECSNQWRRESERFSSGNLEISTGVKCR